MKKPRGVAIPELVREYGGRLFSLGLRLCGSPEDAEDLVQETFLRAYRKWDQFEGRSKPSTWLFTIASRVCQRLHRRRAGEPKQMESFEALLPFGEPTLGVVDDGLEAQVRAEEIGRMERALAELPIAFRLPLVLRDVVGFPVAEVAAILGLKEATVKTRVHRARLKIRKALEQGLPQKALPAAAYSRQVCLDLLRAKQEALDRGAAMRGDVVCERCRAVFATMDLAQDVCARIGNGEMPTGLRDALIARVSR